MFRFASHGGAGFAFVCLPEVVFDFSINVFVLESGRAVQQIRLLWTV